MAVTGWLAAPDEKSHVEGTINLYLPEGGEAIPVPFDETFNWGSLLDVAATLSDFPEHRLSLCAKTTAGHFIELRLHSNDIVGSHIENDQDLRVLVDYHEKRYSGQHEDPPGVKVDSRPGSPKQHLQIPSHATASLYPDKDAPSDEDEASAAQMVNNNVSPTTPLGQGRAKVDIDTFLDPVTFSLMADPVVCSDGNTYDRAAIEHHFEVRRQAALERESGEDEDGEATTCCGRRQEIELTSPLTGNVVNSLLIPNRHVEKQVVELVESGRFDLSEKDLADWKTRREQKRINDGIRVEFEREEAQAAEQRRQNAARAQELRDAEESQGVAATSTGYDSGGDLSTTFRLCANVNAGAPGDIGLAVPLCTPDAKMDRRYFLSLDSSQPRCMVNCCAKRLSPDSSFCHCDRCGRVACPDCLQFSVSDYHIPGGKSVAHVCTECVMQLTDAMPREGQVGRCRAMIVRTELTPRLESIFVQASQSLESAEAVLVGQVFSSDIEQAEAEIQELETSRRDLEVQIRQAEAAARGARDDKGEEPASREGTEARSVEEWIGICSSLRSQLDELLDQIPSDDEDAQLDHTERISDVRHRFEDASLKLGEAMSREIPEPLSRTSSSDESPSLDDMGISDLQGLLEDLELEMQTKSSATLNDEAASLKHALRVSKLSARLDEVQTRLLKATTEGPATASLEQVQREYYALVEQMEATVDPNQRGSLVIRLSELEAILQRAQEATLDQTTATASDDVFDEWWKALDETPDSDWPLPLDLVYPSTSMTNHIELLKNRLERIKLERRALYEDRYSQQLEELRNRKDDLEETVVKLRAEVSSAQESAAAEEERLATRRARHQREAAERRRREQDRLERERQIRAQEAQLRAKHAQDEADTNEALRRAVGTDGNARVFGGQGDLRMCGRCKAGPFENMACSDMAVHNTSETIYKGVQVMSKSNPNHCPSCDWFDPHWHNWPIWDGVMGPH